jgi:DNA-binding LytR/AlgR family response regulator
MSVVAISRWIMGVYTSRRPISYVHYIMWVASEIIVMSVIFTIAALFTDTAKDVVTLFRNTLVKTILILLIPYVMCYIYFIWQERVAQLRIIKERLAEDETALQAAYLQIFDEKGEMRLSVRREHLLMIESADNYVCVWYIYNNAPKKVLVRNTLKHVADHLSSTHVQRCHRSYMVNVMKINHITKGGKARYIVLSNNDIKPIPVSKSYFKNLVEKIDKYNSTVLVNRQEEAAETISEEVNTADAQ